MPTELPNSSVKHVEKVGVSLFSLAEGECMSFYEKVNSQAARSLNWTWTIILRA